MPKLLITITGQNRRAMIDLLHKHRIEIVRQTARVLDDEQGFSVDAIVDTPQYDQLLDLGYQIEIKEKIEEIGIRRQSLVGKGDRFRDYSPE
ncbi:MAG: hypothetical protein PVH43_10235 [Desulfobacterales bacterium]|jgi:hypothetical protein